MTRTALLGCVLLVGCVDELPEDEVSTTEQELGAWGSFVLNCGSGATCESNIGTATNRTCFLGGISGPLSRDWNSYEYHAAGVYREGNSYILHIENAPSVTVTAICISGATNRVDTYWSQNMGGPIAITGGTVSRRCFLSRVATDHGFDTGTDYVTTYKDTGSNTWYLNGNHHGDWGSAYNVCVDVPELIVANASLFLHGAGSTGSLLTTDTTAACGLTRIGGQYHVAAGANTGGMKAFFSIQNWWMSSISNDVDGITKFGNVSCVR
jgi:hypothetical protein